MMEALRKTIKVRHLREMSDREVDVLDWVVKKVPRTCQALCHLPGIQWRARQIRLLPSGSSQPWGEDKHSWKDHMSTELLTMIRALKENYRVLGEHINGGPGLIWLIGEAFPWGSDISLEIWKMRSIKEGTAELGDVWDRKVCCNWEMVGWLVECRRKVGWDKVSEKTRG